MNLRKFLGYSFLSAAAQGVQRVAVFSTLSVAQSRLETNHFGLESTVISFIVTGLSLFSTGTPIAGIKFLGVESFWRRDVYKYGILQINIILAILAGLVVFVFGCFDARISSVLEKNRVLYVVPIFIVSLTLRSVLQAERRYFAILVSSAISGGFLLAAFHWEWFGNSLIESYVISSVVELILLLLLNFRFIVSRPSGYIRFNSVSMRRLMKFCVPATANGLVMLPTALFLPIIVISFGSLSQVGLFNIAMQWRNVAAFIPSAMAPLVLSNLVVSSKFVEKKGRWGNKSVMRLIVTSSAVAALMLLAVGYLPHLYKTTGDGIELKVLYGISIICALLMCINLSLSSVLIANERIWASVKINIIFGAIVIGIAYAVFFFIPAVHNSAALVAMAALSVGYLLSIFCVRRVTSW